VFFGIDDPFLLAGGLEQSRKSVRIGQRGGLAGELKLARTEGLIEQVEELAAEDSAQCFDGEQEIITVWDPTTLVQGQSAGGDKAVQMKVVSEGLVPGMEYVNQAECSPQVSAGKLQQGL